MTAGESMESVGPFKILERLGAGALGELFRARDIERARTVALRVVSPAIAGDPAARERLLADARAAAALVHPRLASLLAVVEHDGALLLVHELVEGRALASLLAAQPLEPARAANIAAQVADAIEAAGAAGLVHGALEPASIIVGAGDAVKVLDFGLARWTGAGKARRDAAAALEGTAPADAGRAARAARYVSPEQLLGSAGDTRSDVFSLGVILEEMLTGQVPFAAEGDAGATVLKVLQAPPVLPTQVNRAVPSGFDTIVQRAIGKSLEARYPGGHALAADLRAFEATLPRPTAVPEPAAAQSIRAKAPVAAAPPVPASHRWRNVALVALVVLLLAAAGAWFARDRLVHLWQGEPPSAPRPVVIVLPFAVGGDNPAPYLGPGFAEALAARLSEVPGTVVVGRSSIRALDALTDWRTRARKLGAAIAVRGTLRPGPYAWHADVEVLDAGTGTPKWSQHFQREPRQVSALEAEIAGRLAQYLRLPAPASNRWARASVRQVDPAAYDLYLQGREAADRRDRSKAIDLYNQALERDPRLVEARASLSQALYLEEYYAGSSREPSGTGRALREAEAALAVDAELPAAHVAAALSAPTATMAASALAKALAYDPSNGEAWHYAGDLVTELDPPRSIPFYRASLLLEPTIDASWRDIASAQVAMGNEAEAAQSVIKGEAARPDRPWWKQMRALADIDAQRYDAAATSLLSDPSAETTPMVWLMGRVLPLSMAGRVADARREATRLVERYPSFCEGRAVLAGVELDGGSHERGRQLATSILGDAARPEADPSLRVCAALAAAAIGDPAEAASWLSRVAGDDRAMRVWTRQAIFGVGLSFRSHWYPWTKVIGSQPVQVATTQLEQTLSRLRDEVERRLPLPPGPMAARR